LIDVEEQCLVQKPGSSRYSALSYVWGKPTPGGLEPFQTKLNNHIELRQRGAFVQPSIQSRIPETIKDSMFLTKEMNIRYLWCDRFCIIQDDPVTKPAQLKAMAAIYANAHITIAACEGENDKYGLPGINRIRSRPFTKFDFDPTCRMVSLEPTRSLNRQDAQYHTRGWIFQEWTLSPRILAFHHHTVSWVCRKLNQQEHGAKVPPYILSEDLEKRSLVSEKANTDAYAEMVMEYSSRDLTYQGDAFFAFSAIITAMGRSMLGGILFGLPEMIFDGALLWMTRGFATRRTDGHGRRLPFPSWSWVAWNG
ncbi:HET-domain-containing protein, partial [Melanomma pulvis-pyrius CBS 109.77]